MREIAAALILCCTLPLAAIAAGTAGATDAAPIPEPSLPPYVSTAPHSAAADEHTYDRCMALTRSDPTAAEKLAVEWQRRGGAHPAEHCEAVALIGLKRYNEAAGKLEKLGAAMAHAPARLRADVIDQAAQAWMLAGDPDKAYAVEGQALALAPDDANLLIDRAVAAGTARHYDKAVADLDRVLKATPNRVDALIYRAAAYRALNKLNLAAADADKAAKLSPDSAPALLERGNVRRLAGDLAGARHDWLRVGEIAPGSPEDEAAKENIAHLGVNSAAAPGAPAAPSK